MRQNRLARRRLPSALLALALLAAAPIGACGDDESPPAAGPCAGTPACYQETCCGNTFVVCQSCGGAGWAWPVDDNCYFACRFDATPRETAADAPEASDDGGDATDDAG